MSASAETTLPGVRCLEHIMGMPIIVDVRDEGVNAHDLEPVFEWFREVDRLFSTFKPDSEISRLNRDELSIHAACADVRDVLQRCESLRVETDGSFDVRAAGSDIDPSGYVKGGPSTAPPSSCAGSAPRTSRSTRAVTFCWRARAAGVELACRCAAPTPARPAREGRRGLGLRGRDLGHVRAGRPLLDARTGLAPAGVLSVTVTGPELGTADAFATAAYARGEEAAAGR